jgi:hypothetical protein
MKDDTRTLILGTVVAFLVFISAWIGFIYLNACGFTLTCVQAAPLVVRTPMPTLIPVKQAQSPQPTPVKFNANECKVAATDLIGAWISAGHTEKDPFPFTDLNGKNCQATFADIQPLFMENSLWFPGSLGCTSCHNADLTDRSSGLDLSSYQAISLGTRRVQGASSPGTDIFGGGDLKKSLLYQVLTTQGLVPQGHSKDAPPPQLIVYAGQVVAEGQATATPVPTATP